MTFVTLYSNTNKPPFKNTIFILSLQTLKIWQMTFYYYAYSVCLKKREHRKWNAQSNTNWSSKTKQELRKSGVIQILLGVKRVSIAMAQPLKWFKSRPRSTFHQIPSTETNYRFAQSKIKLMSNWDSINPKAHIVTSAGNFKFCELIRF